MRVKPEWEPVPAGGKGALLSAWPQGTARKRPYASHVRGRRPNRL